MKVTVGAAGDHPEACRFRGTPRHFLEIVYYLLAL